MTKDAQDLKKGDDVTWKYGQGHPKGTVESVETGKAETTTKKGNTLTKNGDEENPAVIIKAATGNNAIKKVST
jgi:hypothetical protein